MGWKYNEDFREKAERDLELRSQETTNGGNDHVIMFILHLPLAVFQFLSKIK